MKKPSTPLTPALSAAVQTFVQTVTACMEAHRGKHFPNLGPIAITLEEGGRYIRVVRNDGGDNHRSVYCFVDKTNGDLLKAATWKAPAKHARGNLLTGEWLGAIGPYGIKYLNHEIQTFVGRAEAGAVEIAEDAIKENRGEAAGEIMAGEITK